MDINYVNNWNPFFHGIYCKFLEKFRYKTILFLFISYISFGILYLFRLLNNIYINSNIYINCIDFLTYPLFFGFIPLQISFIIHSLFKDLNRDLFKYMQFSRTNILFCENIKKLFGYKYYFLCVLLYAIPSHIPLSLNDFNITNFVYKISLFPGVFFIGIVVWYALIYAIWLRKIVNVDFILDPYIIRQVSNLLNNFLTKISILLIAIGLIISVFLFIWNPLIFSSTQENIKILSFVYGIIWFLSIMFAWFYQVWYMHNLIMKLKTKMNNLMNNYILKHLILFVEGNESDSSHLKEKLQNNLRLYFIYEILEKIKDPLINVRILLQYILAFFIPVIFKSLYNFLSNIVIF